MKLPLALAGLGATALGLALVIALEMLPSAPIVPVGPTASTADGKPAASPHRAEIDRDDLVEALLARPPFSPLRRPEKVARPADEAHGPANELPRLAGIMISGGQRRAIFQAVGDDKPIVVEEGGELTGWHIDKIVAAAVTLNGPEGSRTIEPVFDPNAKPAEPAMPARVGQPNPPGVPANAQRPPIGPPPPPYDPRRAAATGVPIPGMALPQQPVRPPSPVQTRPPMSPHNAVTAPGDRN